ncbi:hypothetical protein DHX103_14350 [Planococcus sp. X10-3]|uniref:hypothetical protein n=1 Tax=Planococcus sp. X10-3 TaxID=3061240 RepID=UPI003BB1C7D7
MLVTDKQKALQALKVLVERRAKKYDCGLRTTYIQWTSTDEKKGISYPELCDYMTANSQD